MTDDRFTPDRSEIGIFLLCLSTYNQLIFKEPIKKKQQIPAEYNCSWYLISKSPLNLQGHRAGWHYISYHWRSLGKNYSYFGLLVIWILGKWEIKVRLIIVLCLHNT